jgi:hypothetical protein
MRPLLRWMPLRVTVAVGLVVGAVSALVVGYVLLIWLFNPLVFLGTLVAAVAAPVVATAVWRGRWSDGGRGLAEQVALAGILVSLFACTLLAIARAMEQQRVRDLGVPTESDITFWLVLAASALVGFGLLLSTAPRLVPVPVTIALSVTGALGATASVGMAAVLEAGTSCSDTSIDRASWRAARSDDRGRTVTDDERLAAAIVECRLLEGLPRAEVRRRLGSPDHASRSVWRWEAGWVNDAIGPGDGQELIIQFNRDGLVQRAELLHPRD